MSIKVLPNTYQKDKEGEIFPNNENHRKEMKYVTGQPIGSDRHALDVIPMSYSYRTEDAVAEAGSDNTSITLTAHGAKRGDLIRFLVTANSIEESQVTVDTVVSADRFILSAILSANLEAGDTFHILKPQFQRFDDDGSQIVTVSPSPIAFIKDGVATPVNEDTVDPSNNVPLPVKLSGVTGDVNIIAGDLSIQLSDQGVNADVTRIGDGTNQLGINASNEAKVHDAGVLVELLAQGVDLDTLVAYTALIKAKDFATQTTLAAVLADTATIDTNIATLVGKDFATQTTLAAAAASLVTLAAKDFATQTTLNDILSDTAAMDTNIAAINTKVATQTTLAAVNTAIGAVGDTVVSNPASSGSVIAFLKGAVSKLADLILLFPTSIGQKTMAASLSVTIASNQSALPIVQGAPATMSLVTAIGSTAGTTNTAPANTLAFYLTNSPDSENSIRWGTGASSVIGPVLLPGATTPVIPFSGNLPVFATSVAGGAPEYNIVWLIK